jgi:hypothetical protein
MALVGAAGILPLGGRLGGQQENKADQSSENSE